jgi:hypothetical protein
MAELEHRRSREVALEDGRQAQGSTKKMFRVRALVRRRAAAVAPKVASAPVMETAVVKGGGGFGQWTMGHCFYAHDLTDKTHTALLNQ